ncbi:hypothetical protein ACIQU4_27925 [Streptomyces sp. NPDC090741]|uniref:hypothetical protein n=1 Tax=Streptomyces sp. NPDC090741 TaxID=3365967 RepID=UPI003822D9F3
MTVERAAPEAVFVAPTELGDRERMRRAHAAAAQQFQVAASGPEVWGWQGRTLGRQTGHCWLRIVSAEVDKAGGRLWEGTAAADTHVPRSVPRPRLRGVLD